MPGCHGNRAWSQNGSTFSTAYLGRYPGGLGVTDSSEGTGSNNQHTLDNNGQKNYIMFEFSSQVVIDKIYLGYVYNDSDITVWIGTKTDPYNHHLTLNADVLSSLGYTETNTGGSSVRWADINAGLVSGNVLVVAAKIDESDDYVKINKLVTFCPTLPPPLTLGCPSACGDGKVGQPFSASLTRSGGVSPFTFSIISGSLPPGLTLNTSTGAITGTPTQAGTFTYTAKVVDSTPGTPQSATVTCSITIVQPQPQCTEISFTGSSSTSGTAGNINTFNFTTIGLTAKVSAWSRTKGAGGTWEKAYLGAYPLGLGVTDSSEGNGSNDRHTVDNIGRDNYVLFQFSTPIVIDQVFLDYVQTDSDIQVWIGTAAYSTNQTLSDSFLNGLPLKETNNTTSSTSRWANINAGGLSGNVLIVAASTLDTTPDDSFKIHKLLICK